MRGEDGASLVVALGFLMMFGILIPSIAALGSNNLLATVRLQDQRGAVYTADGALDGAIQYLRLPAHLSCGRPPPAVPCPDFEATLNNKTATVSVDAVGGVFDLDRTVLLTAWIDGVPGRTAMATVIVRDSDAFEAIPPVDVILWKSLGSTP